MPSDLIQYLFMARLTKLASTSVFCIALLAFNACCRFDYNTSIPIDPQAIDAEFSVDRNFLVVLTPAACLIHSTNTGGVLNTLILEDPAVVMSLGGDPMDESAQLLAVSENSGKITVYDTKQGKTLAVATEDKIGLITSMCFNSDAKILVVTSNNGTVRAFDWTQAHTFDLIMDLSEEPVEEVKVACDSEDPFKFVVSWTPANNTGLLTFSVFEVLQDYSDIKLASEFTSDQPNMVTDIRASPNGEYLLLRDSSFIYSLNITAEQVSQFQNSLGTGPLTKLNFDKEVKNMATINATHVVVFAEGEPSSDLSTFRQQFVTFTIEEYKSDKNILALSPQGGQVFFVPSGEDSASLREQCGQGTLYVDGQCEACVSSCLRCVTGSNECGKCKDEFFLDNKVCLSCVPLCEICFDNKTCQRCNEPFIKSNDSQCTCPAGQFIDEKTCTSCPDECKTCSSLDSCTACQNSYYLIDNRCERGPSIGIFAAVVGTAGAIMLGVIFVNAYKLVKNKAGKSLLEEEENND